jgi:hypothetical protein
MTLHISASVHIGDSTRARDDRVDPAARGDLFARLAALTALSAAQAQANPPSLNDMRAELVRAKEGAL